MDQMLYIIVFTFIGLSVLLGRNNNDAKSKLKEFNCSTARIAFRKRIYTKRMKLIIFMSSIAIICLIGLVSSVCLFLTSCDVYDELDDSLMIDFLLVFFLSCLVLSPFVIPFLVISYRINKGNMSFYDTQSFLRNSSSYALYLRGFESDNYEDVFHLRLSKSNSFSEYKFSKAISKYCVCVAIGMTKELDAPLGAKRIYVDDDTWKNEVENLMEKAAIIFVLINSRESCIWEILSSVRFVEKTIYIIDNPAKYVLVQEKVKDVISFPHIPTLSMDNASFYLKYTDGVFKYYGYNNSKKGYKRLIDDVFSRR